MKPKALWQSFNSHDCETYYRCPVCNKLFGDWLLFLQKPNENGTKDYCPHCETELEVQRL